MNRRQTIPIQQRYTIHQFMERFPTDDVCLEYLMEKRWPRSRALCVPCGVERKHYRVSGRTAYCCPICGNHIFPLAGTIFHKSSTSLKTWFYVIKLMTSTRAGISAKQIQRETGVTYKTAWRMMKQIRLLMAEKIKLTGPLEIDDAYFGGSDGNRPKHLRSKKEKVTVLGIVERKGRIVTRVIPDVQKESVLPVVAEVVEPKSMIYTDGHATYEELRWMGKSHKHKAVNHSAGQYVDGWAHTNSVDGFWSLVKRGLSGVYYQVGAAYLQSYLDEYTFRFNRRKVMYPMFSLLLERTTIQVRPCTRATRLLAAGR
jgi:transposase